MGGSTTITPRQTLTLRIAAWGVRGGLFLVGWIFGSYLSGIWASDRSGDSDVSTRSGFAFGIALFVLSAVTAFFGLIGLLLLAWRDTRPFGKQVLLSLLLVPLGVAAAWGVSYLVFPERRTSLAIEQLPSA